MRIAIVTETWLPSINGVVTRLVATVRELLDRDHEVMIVCPTVTGRPAADSVAGDPRLAHVTVRHVPSVGVPFIYGGQPWGLPLPRVVRLLDGFKPDLVHAVCPFLLGWAGVLHARGRGLALVCSYHTHIARYVHFYGMGFAERPVWALVRGAHRQAHVNLAASEASRRELEARGVPDVGVWRAGVDLDLFQPRQASAAMRERLTDGHPERRLCLYVGRLAAEKGLEVLLPLAAAGGDRHLALVGEGPAHDDLARAFANAQATLPGAMAGTELAAAYASADVFVFPSITDTLGLVLFEAMASGLPLVAARTPSAEALVTRAPAGGLFDPVDPGAMTAAVERWLDAPIDRHAIASAARKRVVSWQRSTDELLAHYDRAIALTGRRAAA
jgi:glycosyltransferase involved in cell wall biosynthesis